MKQNIKFFAIVISLILLSSVILTGCMYAIVADNGEMKSYDLNGQKNNSDGSGGSIVEGEAPLTQTELQEKFSAYLHRDGNTVTVFSEEQYAELKAVRDNDKRNPLTYEEILFLVNDSINLYFTYAEIRLTNSNRDNVVPFAFDRSGNARIITPEYKGAAAYETYSEAETAYQHMLADIYGIIYYRIYMHDAGFEAVFHNYHSGRDFFGSRNNMSPVSSAVLVEHYQMLAIDDATFSGIDNEEKLIGEYKTLLQLKYLSQADTIIDYDRYPELNSAVLYTSILDINREPKKYRFYIAGPKYEQQIYPTAELENMIPYREFHYEVSASDDQMQPGFSLNYENGTAAMRAGKNIPFAMTGEFAEHDGVLKMYFSDYCYVFFEHENGYVYSAENSKPEKIGGFDFADGLLFEKVCEGVSAKPNTVPPVNNNRDNGSQGNEYLVSHIQITSGVNTIRPFGCLLWSKIDKGDGTFTESTADKYSVADLVSGKTDFPVTDIPKLVMDEGVSYYVQANGQVEKVYLLAPEGDEYTQTETTFDALLSLADGTYFVALEVLLSGNCDSDAPQHSYRYEDVFCLVVGEDN